MGESIVMYSKYYYFRGDLIDHFHLYKGWVDAAKRKNVHVKMITVVSKIDWLNYQKITEDAPIYSNVKIIRSPLTRFSDVVGFLYFLMVLLSGKKVLVHLKKRKTIYFRFLRKVFRGRLKYIIELEGDYLSEFEYLDAHPFAEGFYDGVKRNLVVNAEKQAKEVELADHVIVLARPMKKLLISRAMGGSIEDKISVMATAYDAKNSYYSEALRSEMREELGVDNKCVFIYVGNAYYSWQNLHRTIEIFSITKNKLIKNAYLILLIRKQDHEIVNTFISKFKLAKNDFLLKYVESEEVVKYTNAADIGVLLRRPHVMNEVSSPGKLGDYAASGLAILTTNGIGDYSSLLGGTKFCKIVENIDDTEEVLCKIHALMGQLDLNRSENSAWAAENMSADAYMGIYVDLLKKLECG